MQKLTVIIGFPGSGKSKLASKIANNDPNTIVVNKDAIRSMFRAGKYVFAAGYEDLVRQVAQKTTIRALMEGFDVVVDETHLTPEKRDVQFIKSRLRQIIRVEYVWIDECDIEVLLKRRMKDARGYSKDHWREVIESMIEDFVPPDQYKENVDSIVVKR